MKTITTPDGQTFTPAQASETLEAAKQIKKAAPTTFGFGQIGNPTPQWATWMFRIYFYLCKFAIVVIAMLPAERIPAAVKVEIILWIGISDAAVHGFSRMWGIDTKALQEEASNAFPRI
jgi:uncharacterized membrane protein